MCTASQVASRAPPADMEGMPWRPHIHLSLGGGTADNLVKKICIAPDPRLCDDFRGIYSCHRFQKEALVVQERAQRRLLLILLTCRQM